MTIKEFAEKSFITMRNVFQKLPKAMLVDENGSTLLERKQKLINFTLNAPGAKEVYLAGDFNAWNGQKTPLKRQKNGVWEKNIRLCSGRYQYKFIVDDQWITDPNNPDTEVNELGSLNSVIQVSI